MQVRIQGRLTDFVHHISREKPFGVIFSLFLDRQRVTLHLMTNEDVTCKNTGLT